MVGAVSHMSKEAGIPLLNWHLGMGMLACARHAMQLYSELELSPVIKKIIKSSTLGRLAAAVVRWDEWLQWSWIRALGAWSRVGSRCCFLLPWRSRRWRKRETERHGKVARVCRRECRGRIRKERETRKHRQSGASRKGGRNNDTKRKGVAVYSGFISTPARERARSLSSGSTLGPQHHPRYRNTGP